MLNFVTLDGDLRKKTQKNSLLFLQKLLNFKTFLVKFRFESPVLSNANRTQNKHKKHWKAQAKLLDVLCNDIMRKAKK